MKIFISALLIFSFSWNTTHFNFFKTDASRFVMDKSTSIVLQVNTNVSSHNYIVKNYVSTDTLIFPVSDTKKKTLSANRQTFKLPVEKFKNDSKYLTSLFKETVHADKFPDILLRILSCTLTPVPASQPNEGAALIELTVSGVKKAYLVNLLSLKESPETITVTGNHQLLFSDFKLKPPELMFGSVKAKNEMFLNFHLVMNKIHG